MLNEGSEELSREQSFLEGSDEDRVKMLDGLVLPGFKNKGRQIWLGFGPGYRRYMLQGPTPFHPEVMKELDHLDRLFYLSYIQSVLINIKEHPEVLDTHKKIHLQPRPEDILKVVEALVKPVAEHDDLYESIEGFKVLIHSTSVVGGDQPFIVVQLADNADMDQIVAEFVTRFNDFEPSKRAPRYSQQHGSIVFSAVGDGNLKDYLKRFGTLDRFYDPATNYSRLKADIVHFSPSLSDKLKRPLQEQMSKLL